MKQFAVYGVSLVFILWNFTTWKVCYGECNKQNGPSGSIDCFLGTPYYSKYQWGTCLTNSYIKEKSGGKYHCSDTTATYCYYQCMVEIHGLDRGPVYSDCECTKGATPSPTDSPNSTLPTDCFLGTPYYSKYQWGTCLTNSYIEEKSGGKHSCRDTAATYCYYQCMIEIHDLDRGPVYSDCECTKGATPSPRDSPNSTLPEWCFSPDGSDCSWYRQCLEKEYPCEGSQNGYAVTYAEKFCRLYTSSSSSFSSVGQNWINAVRKCLQVSLVPLLRPWENPSCNDIKKRAFDSHTPCYLHPYKGAPSVCDLPVGDWWKIFWTIKSAFIQASVPSLKGVLQTMLGCGNSYLQKAYDNIKIIKLKVTKKFGRFRRSLADDELDTYASEIADSIADSLDWKSKGVGWFAYSSNDSLSQYELFMNISIIIADKFKLDINTNEQSLKLNLNETLQTFADAVRSGTLKIRVRGTSQLISINTFFACEDVECQEIFMDVAGAAVDVAGAAVDVGHPVATVVICSLHLMYVWLKLLDI